MTQHVHADLTDGWQESPNSHWLMEQLRTFQKYPEVLSHSSLLESQETYVTLNQNSQHARGEMQSVDSFEESTPLQVLFASKGSSLTAASDSDIGSLPQSSGSGRLSSQSSLEYSNNTWPPKGPGYTYMAVADSGVSMDYSPMSFSRITDMGNGTTYANEYKNYIPGHKQPHNGQSIQYGYWSKIFGENKTKNNFKTNIMLLGVMQNTGVRTRMTKLLHSQTFRMTMQWLWNVKIS